MSRLTPYTALLVLSGLLCSAPASADDARYNQISLRAEVSQEIPHDIMRVTLFREAQGTDPAKLSQTISQALNSATQRAQQDPKIKVSTGNRHSYAIQDSDNKHITGWRERGEIILESDDFAALSALTGELLASLNMGNLSFAVANKTRLQHEDELIQQAVDAFKARAKIATQAWGGKDYRLISLSLDGSSFQPVMRMQRSHDMVFKAESAAAPEIAAGTSQVSMSASGVIEVLLP